jgi:hypothetical protein
MSAGFWDGVIALTTGIGAVLATIWSVKAAGRREAKRERYTDSLTDCQKELQECTDRWASVNRTCLSGFEDFKTLQQHVRFLQDVARNNGN